MAVCLNCGSELSDGARFCAACGTPVQTAHEANDVVAPAEPANAHVVEQAFVEEVAADPGVSVPLLSEPLLSEPPLSEPLVTDAGAFASDAPLMPGTPMFDGTAAAEAPFESPVAFEPPEAPPTVEASPAVEPPPPPVVPDPVIPAADIPAPVIPAPVIPAEWQAPPDLTEPVAGVSSTPQAPPAPPAWNPPAAPPAQSWDAPPPPAAPPGWETSPSWESSGAAPQQSWPTTAVPQTPSWDAPQPPATDQWPAQAAPAGWQSPPVQTNDWGQQGAYPSGPPTQVEQQMPGVAQPALPVDSAATPAKKGSGGAPFGGVLLFLGGVALVAGSFLNWAEALVGNRVVVLTGFKNALGNMWGAPGTIALGAVLLLASLVYFAGASSKRVPAGIKVLTAIASLCAFGFVVYLLIGLVIQDTKANALIGLWVCLAGSVLAVIGSLFGRTKKQA